MSGTRSQHKLTLLEIFWQITLYMPDDAIANLCDVKISSNRGKGWKFSPLRAKQQHHQLNFLAVYRSRVSQEISLQQPETKIALKTNFQQTVLYETNRNKVKLVYSNKKLTKCNIFWLISENLNKILPHICNLF